MGRRNGGAGATTDIETPTADAVPAAFQLHGVYPNPFFGTAKIRFDLPAPGQVRLAVYDVLGRTVWAGAPRRFDAGQGLVYTLEAPSLAAGVYVYRLIVEVGTRVTTASGLMTRVR